MNPHIDEEDIRLIAEIAHSINRAYCRAIGDDSQPPWSSAPEWQRKSAVKGVRTYLSNLDATPEFMHEAWTRYRKAEGWVFGPVKDPEKKEHPRLVPYNELPAEQRVKDHLFLAVCDTILNTIII